MVVGRCILEVLFDYIMESKQYLMVENFKSDELKTTSDVPQGSVLGQLVFCISLHDLPDLLKFREPYIFVD